MRPQQERWVEGQRASLGAALGMSLHLLCIIPSEGGEWAAGKDPVPVCCWRSQCDKQALVWTKPGGGCPTHFYVEVTNRVLDVAHSCGGNQPR